MKFLLVGINSKFIHSNLAVHSLKNYVDENSDFGSCIEIKEYTINQRKEEILASIFKENPDYIGFSCYIWNWSMVRELLVEIPKLLPETEVFLGGPEVSYDDNVIFENFPGVSAVIVGEGEKTILELVEKYCIPENREPLSSIKGLKLPSGMTGYREVMSMDEVPFSYEKELFEHKIVYYESSRGCPFRCGYCLSSIDKDMRFRSLENVFKHLDIFLNSKVPQVKFIDRTFNSNHNHSTKIWQYIQEHDNGVTNFHFEIAADIMTDEEIDIISRMRPGLVQLEIGVQSTNEKTLREINRYVNTSHIKEVTSKLLKPHNAHVHLDLIAGLPFEDYESFKKSFDEVFNMNPHQLQLGFLKVLKGTVIESKIDEYEIKFLDTPPYEVLSTKWISYGDIIKLKKIEEVLEIYYNSAQFTNTLPVLMKEFESPFAFFDALACYFDENDYFVKTPARSRRYDILLEFSKKLYLWTNEEKNGEECSDERIEEIRDLLTLDYYLREKPKSKPDFVRRIPDLEFDYEHRDPITYNALILTK
ncbi:MAG: B12-binding domain-containing radical SAM protein [Lachnospiraceae bacterium]|nr:B12-binding domain-containing radical SAM protein [Lachnospiraceae bacterium]